MTIIKAAAVQISPVLYSREGTVDRIVRKIIELGGQGVQFATFPGGGGALLSLFLLRAAAFRDGYGTSQVA